MTPPINHQRKFLPIKKKAFKIKKNHIHQVTQMSNSTLSSLQEIQQQHQQHPVGRSLTQKITKTHHHLEAAKLSKHEAILNHNAHYNHRSAARAACRASR